MKISFELGKLDLPIFENAAPITIEGLKFAVEDISAGEYKEFIKEFPALMTSLAKEHSSLQGKAPSATPLEDFLDSLKTKDDGLDEFYAMSPFEKHMYLSQLGKKQSAQLHNDPPFGQPSPFSGGGMSIFDLLGFMDKE